VAYDKASDFVGKSEAIKERDAGGNLRLVTFKVAAKDSDAIGDEPIWHNGEVKGWITSGGYAHAQDITPAQPSTNRIASKAMHKGMTGGKPVSAWLLNAHHPKHRY